MANSDIIKIGFDYRASLEQFEKETNGVFDGISDKAGKQKITIQLDAKDDKVIDKIKELQKLKLDKFTFEFGNSGLKEQLQTFDKLENKINEIISLSKGIDLSFNTKNKTEAYNQLKKYADAFKEYYGNEEAMATNAGAKAGYAYYKAYEEALRKGVAQSKLEKVTVDFDVNDSIFSKERIVENRIKEFENFQKYGNADESNLIAEITSLENRLLKFNSAYSQVKANLGDAPITPEITKNIEEYVRLLEVAESRAKDAEIFGYSYEDINSDKDLANMYLDFAKEDAIAENKKYIESLKQEETQATTTAEAEQKLAEVQKETVSNTSNSNDSQIEELKSDIQEVKTELGDVKDRISSIESNGFENVREDVEKTKESVKELNSELTEMKSNLSSTPQESNISSGRKDAFPDKDVSAYVESATNSIKKENNALEQNTQKVKENTQAKEQNANINLNKYDKRLDSYNGKVDKYQATIDRFNDGGWTSKTYLENVQAVRDAVKQYATLLDNIKTNQNGIASDEDIQNLDKYEKKIKDTIATVTNMSAAEKGYNFVSGQKELDKIHKLLAENSKMSSEAKNKIRAYYREIESGNPNMSLDKIHGEIMKIYNAEVEAGRAGRSFFDTLKNSGFHQLAAQMAGMFGFYDVINLGKEAISTIVSLDDALVDLKKTTAMNSTQLEDFYYDANDVAKQMGVTTEEIITQASAWSRLGYSSQEAATTMAKLSSKFASISPGMSTDEAQEGLVSIMKAFDIDPDDVETEIMDKVNVLGNKFAEENQDVIEGLKRSAAAMSAMGQSFTDTAALFTGGMEILQDSESMGTALRTLSMRVRGYDEETNQLSDDLVNVTGEVADLTKTAQDSQGVSLFTDATQEHYRSMVEYLGDIADRWDQISEKNQTELLQKLFGKNRANAGAAIIQNFDQVRAAIEAMDESAGSSEAEMSAIESSLSYKINALKETWVGCVQDMIDRGDLGTIVTGLTKVSEAITFLLDKLGILGTIGLGAGIFSGIKNVGRDKMYSLSF